MDQMSSITSEVEASHFDQAQELVNHSKLDSAEKEKLCCLIAHCQSIEKDLHGIGGLQQTYNKTLFFVEKDQNTDFYAYVSRVKDEAVSCLLLEIARAFAYEAFK